MQTEHISNNKNNYIEKVLSAIDFIERRLTESITLEEVCEHVFTSKFYFSRIFLAMTGETVFDYIRKRRLSEIAHRLLNSAEPVVDIALQFGYESQQSMSKSFKELFQVSPGRYRRDGLDRLFFRRMRPSAEELMKFSEGLRVQQRLVHLPALRIAGIKRELPVNRAEPAEKLRTEFAELLPALKPHLKHTGYFELTLMSRDEIIDFTEEKYFMAMIGCSIKEELIQSAVQKTGSDQIVIPRRSYLLFRYRGANTIADLNRVYRHIFSTGLLKRREELADCEFFHYYGARRSPCENNGECSVSFFMPLKENQ